ncbi:MAG: GNAT family N-acetyltransferase [Candidatus Thorarchaeota archaeon]
MARKAEIVEEINDNRVFLRKINKHDAEFFFYSLNDKNLTSYLSLGPLKTLENSKRLIRGYLKYWDSYTQFNYIIELAEKNKQKVGSVSLWNINWQHLRAQIGIWLVPKYWGSGFGKKALNLLKNIAFFHLQLNRLEAYIAKENIRSIYLFEKCNFQKEGILRKYLNFEGNYHDAILMAYLK